MIFQSSNVNKTINDLEEIIRNSIISEINDRFLLACWNDRDGFEFRLAIKQ